MRWDVSRCVGMLLGVALLATACGGSEVAPVESGETDAGAGQQGGNARAEPDDADDAQSADEVASPAAEGAGSGGPAEEAEVPAPGAASGPGAGGLPELGIVQEDLWVFFDTPNHLDVGPDGNIYLTEFNGGRVYKISPDGTRLAQWGEPGTEPGQLLNATGLAVDAEGFVYVAESGGHRVQKFSAEGELVVGWGERGTGEGEFLSAMGIDIGEDGRVYVADFGNSRVQVFSQDGAFLFSFSGPGSEPGRMINPIGLDLDTNGDVLVVDTGNTRVLKFSPEGEPLAVYDELGLGGPQVISARPGGGFLVADPWVEARIVAFDAEGVAVGEFPTSISYQGPHGTATGPDGAIYLAETGNNAVRKFVPVDTAAASEATPIPPEDLVLEVFPVEPGSRPHDVAPAADGGVWYTAQNGGALGWLDPASGRTRLIPLGAGSRPHGVIVGPQGAAWVTDGGLNAIVRVDPASDEVTVYPLPAERANANLNTAAFGGDGRLWFTGQNGIVGRLDPATGAMEVFDAPRGRGPYGIAATPAGDVYFASLAGSYVGAIDLASGAVEVLEPPTAGQGARRVWSDSGGRIWVSEWNVGRLARYDPGSGDWREWPLPGSSPQAYAVFVDETDIVWVSDFGGNAIHRFDPRSETFATFPLPSQPGNVRQILGRPGEVWAPESAADQLIVIRRKEDT